MRNATIRARQFKYHEALGLSVSACANLQLEPRFVLQFLAFKSSSFDRDCQGPGPNRRRAIPLSNQRLGRRSCHLHAKPQGTDSAVPREDTR
jgi:hypothetical protein